MALILVAYSTKYGSTREVAERVADTLIDGGHDAEVRDAKDVRDLDGFSAVVLGGALYFFRWRRDARHFLSKHRKQLESVPVAIFGMGPIEDTPEQFEDARGRLDKALGKFEWLTPVSVEVFGGKLDPEGLRFPDNNPAMKNLGASDLRDWAAIEAWARSLPGEFGFCDN
jgi:menaquinone-dependent protoporphyrinogen oxidase